MRENDNWSLAYLAREAVRNVLNFRARLFPLLLIAVLLGSGLIGLAVKETRDFQAQITSLADQGRNVIDYNVDPDDNEADGNRPLLNRDECENLNTVSGVKLAGLSPDGSDRLKLAQLGALAQIRSISPTLIPQLHTYDLVIGKAAAEKAGLPTTGEREITIATPEGSTLKALIVPGLGPEVESTLSAFQTLDPAKTRGYNCRVVLEDTADVDEMTPILTASLGAIDGTINGNSMFQEQIDVKGEYLNRIERFAPLAAGVFGGLIVAILAYMRSSELAAYRLSGTSPRSLGMMLGLETALIAGMFLTAGGLAVLTLRDELLTPVGTLMWLASGAGVWLITTWLLTLPILRRKPSDMAKDR